MKNKEDKITFLIKEYTSLSKGLKKLILSSKKNNKSSANNHSKSKTNN